MLWRIAVGLALAVAVGVWVATGKALDLPLAVVWWMSCMVLLTEEHVNGMSPVGTEVRARRHPVVRSIGLVLVAAMVTVLVIGSLVARQ